ncbi:MAG: CoA transferase, partial [Chloroflexota bacterium]
YILNMYINTGPRWASLCQALGLEELTTDPRFATSDLRVKNSDAIVEILSRHFLTKSSDEWEAIFKAAGHTNSIVKTVDEMFEDPQIVANDMVTSFDQPNVGEVTMFGLPFRMSGTDDVPWLRRPVPRLGEHTDEVLRELGYTADEISALTGASRVEQESS